MPAPMDITGDRYGRLTAISLDQTTGERLWLFRCDCGSEKLLRAGLVRSGRTSSCGCLRKETTAKARSVNLTGQKIGRLYVHEKMESRDKHRQVQWLCRCDCGTDAVMTTHKLGKKNPTLSCGCLQREFARALGASSRKENPISRTPAYKAAARRKRRAQPHFAMAERVSRMLSWALASVGAVKRGRTFDMLGYSPTELKEHLERQFVKGMTWDNRPLWQIDHIVPISTATCEDDVLALNQLPNLRPMWSVDNNIKRNNLVSLL